MSIQSQYENTRESEYMDACDMSDAMQAAAFEIREEIMDMTLEQIIDAYPGDVSRKIDDVADWISDNLAAIKLYRGGLDL